ncbi:MAG TPA: sigma 54-interacting transcriptional regulator, partial [Kofleriaceae bacterium]
MTEFDLAPGELTVGRSPTCQIAIDSASVSRAHALVDVSTTAVVVRDLQSTNGTFVNGVKVGSDPIEIKHGDALRFGDIVAHVKARRATRSPADKIMTEPAFEQRLSEEADRCVRYNRSLAVLAIEVVERDAHAETPISTLLRSLDAAVVRSSERIDVLAPECDRDQATTLAKRIVDGLAAANVRVRVGLATFPGDAPSPSSLSVAAEMALASVTIGAIGTAREGVRHLSLGGREVVIAEPAMTRLFGVIERVGRANAPVLVRGETGSGKEIVAEALHSLSARSTRRLVRINCAAMPAHLVESELFGHVRGAFSGAERDKIGLFEEATGGTLFLDEIGEFELGLQAKLLRVLEDGRIRRVGATTEISVDVRVIAATNRDLKAEAAAGRFRQDLYYRLGAIVLHVPPLRERVREIPLLVERFVLEAITTLGREPPRVSPQAMAILRAHPWPGNVRELRNVIQRALVVCDGQEIRPEHIDLEAAAPTKTPPMRRGSTSDDDDDQPEA